jgi:hypothetical protein
VGKKELLYTVGGSVNECFHGKQMGSFSKTKSRTTVIPLYSKERKSTCSRVTYTPMSVASDAISIGAYQQMNKKTMWYLYTMESYSAIKNEIMSFAGKFMLGEISQTPKHTKHIVCFLSLWNINL